MIERQLIKIAKKQRLHGMKFIKQKTKWDEIYKRKNLKLK